jgi:hypothetical protein
MWRAQTIHPLSRRRLPCAFLHIHKLIRHFRGACFHVAARTVRLSSPSSSDPSRGISPSPYPHSFAQGDPRTAHRGDAGGQGTQPLRQAGGHPLLSPLKHPDHRGFRCTPRITGNGGKFPTRDTVSRTSAVAGRTTLPLGRRERKTDGSAAGGHPHFFRNPFAANSARQPAIRLHLMRDPVNRPFGLPRRERAGPLAFREFARSRIRCS